MSAKARREMVALIRDGYDTTTKMANHLGISTSQVHRRLADCIDHQLIMKTQKPGKRGHIYTVTHRNLNQDEVAVLLSVDEGIDTWMEIAAEYEQMTALELCAAINNLTSTRLTTVDHEANVITLTVAGRIVVGLLSRRPQ